MTTTASVLSCPGPAFPKAAPLASLLALQTWAAPALPLRPLSLRRGNVVRIENGAGTLVHVRLGIVWITEEGSRRDVFLSRGQVHRIDNGGVAILHADRDARIVLEFASGTPDGVVVAAAAGEPGRAMPLPMRSRRATFASLVEAARSFGHALRRWWNAAREEDVVPLHRPQRIVRWEPEPFTPEAVRARILYASPFPYC